MKNKKAQIKSFYSLVSYLIAYNNIYLSNKHLRVDMHEID